MIFCWDDDPGGNVEHIAEHGLTPDEVESAFDDIIKTTRSNSSGRPALFGRTYNGDKIFVVYEIVPLDGEDYCSVYTAYKPKDIT